LLDHGARVKAYDPAAVDNVRPLFPRVEYCDSSYGAAEGVDGLEPVERGGVRHGHF